MAESYQQRYITVNENYLKLYPLYNIDGKKIEKSDFDNHKYNFLIAKGDKNYSAETIKQLCLTEDEHFSIEKDVNIIFYKPDQEIVTFDSQVALNSAGKLDNPIIRIYNPEKDIYGDIESYMTSSYFVKISSDKEHQEMLSCIKKDEMDNIILSLKSVSDSFLTSEHNYREIFRLFFMQTVIYTIGLIILTIFSVKNYFLIYKQKISVKKLNGYSMFAIHRFYFLLMILIYLIVLGICWYRMYTNTTVLNMWVWLGAVLSEMIAFVITAGNYTRKTILEILKGN